MCWANLGEMRANGISIRSPSITPATTLSDSVSVPGVSGAVILSCRLYDSFLTINRHGRGFRMMYYLSDVYPMFLPRVSVRVVRPAYLLIL